MKYKYTETFAIKLARIPKFPPPNTIDCKKKETQIKEICMNLK